VKRIESIRTKTHATGIVTNKPRVAYDAVHYMNPSSIAAGLIDHIEVDPTTIKWAFENPNSGPVAAASIDRMDRGTLAHMMLLQPGRVGKDVAVWTGGTRKGAAWDDFSAASVGKLVMREQDYDAVTQAVQAFQFEPMLRDLLVDLDAEVAMFSTEHSFYVKGLVDAVTRGPVPRIIDLKTTEAGFSRKAVERTIRDFRNREKMAAYRRWYAKESKIDKDDIKCFNVFLNMVPPYGVRVQQFTTQALEWGEQRIVAALDAVEECLTLKSWPMFATQADMVMVSDWEAEDEEIEI
jgi:hypothetical protein